MKKIADALEEIINANPPIKSGLFFRLINISRLAKHLKPLVELRTKKDLNSVNALIMALSRYQREQIKCLPSIDSLHIKDLTIYPQLYTATYVRSQEVLSHISELYKSVQKDKKYIALSQGTNEVTIIIDDCMIEKMQSIILAKPINEVRNVSAISIKFDQKYYQQPGVIFYLLQQISLQGISLCEISSTFTEIIVYVDKKDVKILFDTIYGQFFADNLNIFKGKRKRL